MPPKSSPNCQNSWIFRVACEICGTGFQLRTRLSSRSPFMGRELIVSGSTIHQKSLHSILQENWSTFFVFSNCLKYSFEMVLKRRFDKVMCMYVFLSLLDLFYWRIFALVMYQINKWIKVCLLTCLPYCMYLLAYVLPCILTSTRIHTCLLYIHTYRFYTYGNFPLERRLQLIEELALKKFEKIPVDTSVPKEPRWVTPVCIIGLS